MVSYGVVPAPDRHGVSLDNLLQALGVRYDVDAMTVRAGDLPYVQTYRRARMLRVPVGSDGPRQQVEVFRRALRRQLEGADYDVIHLRDACGGPPACQASQSHETKLVFELARGSDELPVGGDASLPSELAADERECLRRADLVLVSSRWAGDHLSRLHPALRLGLFPPAVNIDLFDWEPVPLPREPLLLYVGRVAPGRGLRLLVQAVAEVARERPCRLRVVGADVEGFGTQLAARAAELGIAERLELLGAVEHEELPRHLAEATLCVVPQLADPLRKPFAACPLTLLEFAACRRPVVAPERPQVTELFVPEAEVATFAPDDVHALAQQVLALLGDGELRRRIAERAYDTVRRGHAASAARRKLLAAYQTILPPRLAAGDEPTGDAGPSLATDDTTTAQRLLEAVPPAPRDGDGGSAEAWLPPDRR